MGTSLFNTTPQATYPSLIKLSDNLPLTATFKALSDGLGNDSVLALSTISLQIGGATGATWDNTNKRLGIGTTTPSFTIDAVGGVQATGIIRGERVQVGTAATLNDATGVGNTLQFANYNPSVFVTASADSYIYKNSNVFGGLPAQTLIFQTRSDTTGGGFTFVAGGTPAPIVTMLGGGNVGIGTTTPSLGAISGTRVLTIASPESERWGILELAGNRTFGGNQVGEVKFISTDATNNGTLASLTCKNDATALGTGGSLEFKTRPNGGSLIEVMTLTSDKYLRMESGTGGIQFNGDTAAANALDDYEEGTWTPTFGGTTFSGTNAATYTKIGRLVTVQMNFVNQTLASSAGTASISGLPFTCNSSTFGIVSFTFCDALLASVASGYVGVSGTAIQIRTNTGINDTSFVDGTSNRSMMLNATYFV